ncbi:hypothetical protein [Polynucleobacter sp. IMCC 29146]|uniref:hypothetical protein n=1 Tax=Polynucleobacter sp. IMCC 29146 TaxID=2780953 RepID=UPI001F33DE4A|nr:hypothetical protein [Polynucleobacter sp. IMCC 29146]MCE7530644.1 hypothetical protein [Polynucleobacter sp. IMCC 29146]
MKIKLDLTSENFKPILKFLKISFPEFKFLYTESFLSIEPEPSNSELESIKEIARIVIFAERLKSEALLYEHDPKYLLFKGDVQKDLDLSGDVKWMKPGMALLQGDVLSVKKQLERTFESIALKDYSAVEIENPGLWSMDIFHKTGYLGDFPHEALFVLGTNNASKCLSMVSEHFEGENLTEAVENFPSIVNCVNLIGGCQPSVCTSCYFALGNQMQLQNQLYTTYNRVFRNEGGNTLARLLSYSVRDIMAVGNINFVIKQRNNFITTCKEFMKSLGLKFKIEASNDPFFSKKLKKITFQNSGALKYEVLAYIPFSDSWLAVGSINYHLQTFGEAFEIKLKGGGIASSCCMGIGFERLVFALFSQFGPNLKLWPKEVMGDKGLLNATK